MDRSLNSSLLGNRSPFSPKSRQNISAKRAIAPPAFRKSSRFSVSGRSTQSVNQIILKSQNNYVERFGQPLPVLVTEALTFAERNAVVSARISECGYAWIVCGRRLLVWQYRQSPIQLGTPQRKSTLSNQCYELQLPQSDLAHRAELVSVFLSNGAHTPACIAVSPEGVVRYWPAVAHEGVSIEQCVDLQGQECDSLTDIEGLGCILATTTCTVVLVQPQFSGGRHLLSCHTLKTPSGWLGGISKRMSSLIFGPISSEQSAETRLVRVLSVPLTEDSWIIFVLAGHSLQKWKLSLNESEHLIFVAELNRLVCEGFFGTVWENCGGDQSDTDTWLLDIQSEKDNVILLAAAVNMHLSPQVHYAMVCIQTNSSQPPSSFRDFLVLKMTGLYRDDCPNECLTYRFLLYGTNAYIYNQRTITIIKPQEEPDVLEFNSPQDFLLGGSICVNTPIFFSRNHGLVSICTNELGPDLNASMASIGTPLETTMNESAIGNLTLYNLNPEEMCSSFKDIVKQLKAAFIFHVQNQQFMCNNILQELFFSEGTPIATVDSALDKAVVKVCEDLLDDAPASDPRWSHNNQAGIGSSYSMQVLQQLHDKQKALSIFYNFLKETRLWNQLAVVTVRDTILCTIHILGEQPEKLIMAITLKSIQVTDLLEKAIEKSVDETLINPESGLTNQDVFYREVTQVHRGVQELVNYCEDVTNSDLNPSKIANTISECNDILLVVFKEVIQYRQTNAENFVPSANAVTLAPEYLPWTTATGSEGLHNTLLQQHSLTYNYGLKYTSDLNLSNILYDQFVFLTDIILDGYKSHLESIKGTEQEAILLKQYQTDRHKLISPLVANKEWDRAALLAEKYLDFETLVSMCESTDNQQRLDEYMERFSAEGFSEYVYSWYLQENKQGKLINRCKTMGRSKNINKLTNFLSDHPSLSWMQDVFHKKYENAAETLYNLATQESESVRRQKTVFSLSKLSRLAVPGTKDTDEFIENVNSNLELIIFQEEVPDYVLQQFGYDTVNPRVIPPKELVHLYTCSEYKDATELEFKKALDLLVYVSDGELANELKLKIWRAAILRDSWNEKNLDCPMEILQSKLFYRLAELALILGADAQLLLPPLDVLTEDSELAELQENRNFQFLLKIAYESIYKAQYAQ